MFLQKKVQAHRIAYMRLPILQITQERSGVEIGGLLLNRQMESVMNGHLRLSTAFTRAPRDKDRKPTDPHMARVI